MLAYSFLFAPMVLVVLNSVNKDQFRTHWAGLTFEWYRAAWSDPTIVDAAKNSLVIATLVAVLSTIIGTSTSLSLQRSRRWMHAVISSTTYSRLIIPEILLALALLIMFSRIGIARGTTTIVIGQVVFNSAYITVVVSARLAVRERHTEEAARDLGATAFRAFRRVTLPEIMPAIIAGAVLAFTSSLDNIVTSFFLSGLDEHPAACHPVADPLRGVAGSECPGHDADARERSPHGDLPGRQLAALGRKQRPRGPRPARHLTTSTVERSSIARSHASATRSVARASCGVQNTRSREPAPAASTKRASERTSGWGSPRGRRACGRPPCPSA